jgi:hypothetical protein
MTAVSLGTLTTGFRVHRSPRGTQVGRGWSHGRWGPGPSRGLFHPHGKDLAQRPQSANLAIQNQKLGLRDEE